jgi:hypothetical protein
MVEEDAENNPKVIKHFLVCTQSLCAHTHVYTLAHSIARNLENPFGAPGVPAAPGISPYYPISTPLPSMANYAVSNIGLP